MKRLALLALLAMTLACSSAPPQASQPLPPVPVKVSIITTRHVPRTFEAGGVVRARTFATLASRITAPVLSVRVAAGQRVPARQTSIMFDGRGVGANRGRAAKQPFETGEIEDDLIRCMQFESRGETGRDFEQCIRSRAIDRTKRAKHIGLRALVMSSES